MGTGGSVCPLPTCPRGGRRTGGRSVTGAMSLEDRLLTSVSTRVPGRRPSDHGRSDTIAPPRPALDTKACWRLTCFPSLKVVEPLADRVRKAKILGPQARLRSPTRPNWVFIKVTSLLRNGERLLSLVPLAHIVYQKSSGLEPVSEFVHSLSASVLSRTPVVAACEGSWRGCWRPL